MPSTPSKAVFAALLSLAALPMAVWASVALPPGGPAIPLPAGTTAAAEPDLAGTVLRDALIPFTISVGGAPVFQGVLQDRVVRSSASGRLHFYRRIRDTRRGLNGVVRSVTIESFAASPRLQADWRPDGLGTVAPTTVQRSVGTGARVRFTFPVAPATALIGGRESRFFYLKGTTLTSSNAGRTRIELTNGASATVDTAMPVAP